MNRAKMRKRMREFMNAMESDDVDLIPIMPLDWAWEQASAALPKGWAIDEVKRTDVYSLSPDGEQATWTGDGWVVTARSRDDMSAAQKAQGNTLAEALIHLTNELEEPVHAAASRT